MSTLVSIDWDFFLWRGAEAKAPMITTHPGTPEAREIDSVWLFDWGHSEGHTPWLQETLWQTRWLIFQQNGLDPMKISGVRPEVGGVSPPDFMKKLKSRLKLDDSLLLYADSHAMGIHAAQEAKAHNGHAPVRIIHFDAHADMGYDEERIRREEQKGVSSCESWLYHALKLGYASEVVIVYPD